MNALLKKILMFTVLSALVFAGIFCYESVVASQHDCMGDTSAMWCDDFLAHGTLIEGALIAIFFSIPILLVAISFADGFRFLFRKHLQFLKQKTRYYSAASEDTIVLPFTLAFSKGLIHPRIP